MPTSADDDRKYMTDSQKEWADWAASGYAKRYQPRSMLRLGFVLTTVLAVGLFVIFWLGASGRLP